MKHGLRDVERARAVLKTVTKNFLVSLKGRK
jgi:hypothetical protein